MLGTNIEILDDQVTLKGNKQQLEAGLAKLNDFGSLRQMVIPVSSSPIITHQCPDSVFSSWESCLTSLGVNWKDLANFSIQDDCEGCLRIPYGTQSNEELTFNQKIANMYVKEIKKRSPYFKWFSQNNPGLIEFTDADEYLTINYGLFNDYFCKLDVPTEQTSEDDVFTSTLSLQTILKRLTAVAGGDISLVPTSIPGQYRVRTVMLGDHQSQQGNRVMEIIIDKSYSMVGEKINEINEKMPGLLEIIRDFLGEDESLKIDVYTFNDLLTHQCTYNFGPSNQSPITWTNVRGDGGTDLTKVGERMHLSSLDERKIVVAFTDGEHESSSDLNESYTKLQEMQREGSFAQPYFCRVGVKSNANSAYFSKISEIFAGSFKDHGSIDEFCRTVALNIPYLLESNTPLVLTLNGENITIRQQDAKPDIHETSQVVEQGDAILYKGFRQYVSNESVSSSIPSITLETDEEKKIRLEQAIAEIQKELAKLSYKPLD